MNLSTLEKLQELRTTGVPVVVVTAIASGEQILWQPGDPGVSLAHGAELEEHLNHALRTDHSRMVEIGNDRFFIHAHNPPLRMFVVGAVHIARFLAPFAVMAGYDVTVIDPRRAFATPTRFPEISIANQWPDDALSERSPDHRSAIVTLTHDPKVDDPALRVALESDAFYIGSLGSRRTHASRLDRLRLDGFEDVALERIHGPIGLDIHASSPAEIAVAIMAEVTQSLRALH